MQISNNIEILDLALYLPKHKTLIIADTHIGYEEALNKQGIMIPRFHFTDLIKRLKNILKSIKPELIIINGDIKHEFGKISRQEWRHTIQLIDFLSKHCKKLILIKGNHDKTLAPIADKRKLEIVNEFLIDDILILHGDKLTKIPKKVKTIIISQET